MRSIRCLARSQLAGRLGLTGGFLWVFLFTLLGYFFGTLPIVQENFEIVVVAIVLISLLPPLWEAIAPRLRGKH